MKKINRIRGTRDILDMSLFNYIVSSLSKRFSLANFEQIELPILENIKLFKSSLGEASDVVNKEIFVVSGERATEGDHDEQICLRPEATVSVVRAYIESANMKKNWKTFLFGPMFRKERPQKGRLRQFYQFNIEIMNNDQVEYDTTLISLLDKSFREQLGIDEYRLKLNFLGRTDERKKYKEALRSFLRGKYDLLCDDCKVRLEKNVLRVLDCKNESCIALLDDAPVLPDYFGSDSSSEFDFLKNSLKIIGVDYDIELRLVRGLDYYNKTVFEFESPLLGSQATFCGGGRYSLGSRIGASYDFESVGAAIGIDRVALLLSQSERGSKLFKRVQEKKVGPVAVVSVSSDQDIAANLLYERMIDSGIRTELIIGKKAVGNKLKIANKIGADLSVIVGPDEIAENSVSVKEMASGQSKKIKIDRLVETIRNDLVNLRKNTT